MLSQTKLLKSCVLVLSIKGLLLSLLFVLKSVLKMWIISESPAGKVFRKREILIYLGKSLM